MKQVLLILLLLISSICYAQKPQTKKVRDVQGKYQWYDNISKEQAKKKALEDAKREALLKADVPESVWSAFGLITRDDGEEFSEIYSENSVWQIEGLVNIGKAGVKYGQMIDPMDGNTYITATIDAEVIVNSKVDNSYGLSVKGLKPIYTDGEVASFAITTYGTDSYLTIFWFDDDKGEKLYPEEHYSIDSKILKKGKEYQFPSMDFFSENLELKMSKNNEAKEYERVHVMIVITKKEIPYTEEGVTYDSILRWIYNIPADERCVHYQCFIVN